MPKYFKYLLVLVGTFCILLNNSGNVLAASSPFSQTDWSGGSGQSAFSDATKFDSSSNVTTSTTGQITLLAASNWYNASWGYRKKITFDNADQSDNLVNFPVLVSLSASNFDYSKAKSSGEDIRFTDSNGTTLLDYEIEKWDGAGTSLLWVEVPQIDGASTTDSIYLYYGNSAASDGQNAAGVWNSNTVLVQHFKETANCPTSFNDSTSNNNDGSCDGTNPTPNASGKINGSRNFDGSDDLVRVPSSSSLQPTTVTLSTWVNAESYNNWNKLISSPFRNDGTWTGPYVSYALGFHNNAGGVLFEISTSANKQDTFMSGTINTGQWYHLVGTYDGTTMRLYVNGVENATSSKSGDIDYNGSSNDLAIGRASPYVNENPFDGTIDEVRIYNQAMSPDWIAATYESENSTFNTYGSEEQQYAASGDLISSIFDTTDAESWGELTYSADTPSGTTATVKVRTSNSSDMTGATAFSSCSAISSGSDISENSCVTDGQRYVQYQVGLGSTAAVTSSTFNDISIAFITPSAPPSSNSSNNSGPQSQSPPTCDNLAPNQAPVISRYLSGETSASLFFSKVEGVVSEYVISYGYDSSATNFSGSYGISDSPTIQQSIKNLPSGATFFFKVRAGNGCATGPWSEPVKLTTTGIRSSSLNSQSPPESTLSGKLSKIIETSTEPKVINSPSPSSMPSLLQEISSRTSELSAPDISFFIPKFEFIETIGQVFTSFKDSLSTQLASLYIGIFNPEPLMITQVKVTEKGEDYVIVTWKTNIPATSKVNFGDSYDYGRDFQTTEKVTDHSVRIDGLEKGKTYYYEVMSQNGSRYSFDARHEFKLE